MKFEFILFLSTKSIIISEDRLKNSSIKQQCKKKCEPLRCVCDFTESNLADKQTRQSSNEKCLLKNALDLSWICRHLNYNSFPDSNDHRVVEKNSHYQYRFWRFSYRCECVFENCIFSYFFHLNRFFFALFVLIQKMFWEKQSRKGWQLHSTANKILLAARWCYQKTSHNN